MGRQATSKVKKPTGKQPLSTLSRILGQDFVFDKIWKCPHKELEQQFKRNITLNHLEVGVTSGFDFTARLKANKNLDIAYLDPNEKALRNAHRSSSHLKPRLFLSQLADNWGFQHHKFASINLNFVLHSMQGNLEERVNALCLNARSCLKENGKIFGSAILRDRVDTSSVTEYFLEKYNKSGVVNNEADSFRKLERMLNYYFANVKIKLIGYIVIFEARMKDSRKRGKPEMAPYNSRKNVVSFPNAQTMRKQTISRNKRRA